MVSQTLFQKSSAKHLATRGFSQKGLAMFIFGHHRCPNLKTFSSLVQIRIEEITNLIYVIIRRNKSIMVSQKNDPKKDDFRTEKVTCDIPQNAYFLFY